MSESGEIARTRQTHFRDHSPTISDAARSPSDTAGLRHGYLLALGHEEENLYPALRGIGGAVDFFRERGVSWHRTGRSGDTRGHNGPTRNMASSQIACANFFLPLLDIEGSLTAVARSIDSDVEEVIAIQHQGRTSTVEFEWIGAKRSLEGGRQRGANNTSVDALLLARSGSGCCAYLLEWKYVEEYPPAKDLGNGKSGDTRRSRYAHLFNCPDSSFNAAMPLDAFFFEPFYQIMRQQLLADRMVRDNELGVTDAKVIVVVPQQNVAYRDRVTSPALASRFPDMNVEAVVRACLKKPNHFSVTNPATLVNAVERACGPRGSEWVNYQQERYGY